MRLNILVIAICLSTISYGQELLAYAGGGNDVEHSVSVCADASSGLFKLNVVSTNRIGNIRFQIRNSEGKVVYSEEGKAKTNELVRYIDKSIFRPGEYQVEVFAKQFNITQLLTVR